MLYAKSQEPEKRTDNITIEHQYGGNEETKLYIWREHLDIIGLFFKLPINLLFQFNGEMYMFCYTTLKHEVERKKFDYFMDDFITLSTRYKEILDERIIEAKKQRNK